MDKEKVYQERKQFIESQGWKLFDKEWKSTKVKLNMQCPEGHLVDSLSWDDFNQGCRCPYCSNRKVLLGYNSILDTDPWMIKLGMSIEDAKTHTHSSGQKIWVTCPDCGNKKPITIDKIYSRHSICCNCGDGAYYPEKLMYNLLTQLNIKFITQLNSKQFSWCDKYKYDFYLPDYNIIIETHGEQHYREKASWGKESEIQKQNDNYKRQLALNNNVNIYIEIDCSKSELKFIKNSILNSKLAELFDLSKIDWNKCEEYALSNIVKEVCNSWNNKKENETTTDIAIKYNISNTAVRTYLHKGNKLGWCKYDSKKEKSIVSIRNGKKNIKKIKCINTDEIFNSMKEACDKYNVNISSMSACCHGKRDTAGKLPDGTQLVWTFV